MLDQIRSVHGAKRPTTGAGSNTVSKYMGQRDLLLVLVQIRSVHGAKQPTTGWDKETYYWCWLKYSKYMGQRDLLLVLAQIR